MNGAVEVDGAGNPRIPKNPRGPRTSSDPSVPRNRWPLVRLGDVCEVRAGDSAPQGEEFYTGGTVPFVRTSDVGIIHFGTLQETHDNLTEAAAVKLRRFKAGSILFPKSGASTYLNHRVLLEIEACVASHLAVITPDAALDSLYLLYALSQVDAKALMQDSSYPALRASEIEAITFPLPPISVQRAIVARLDSALARAGALEKRFAAIAQDAELSFKAMLAEEFGETREAKAAREVGVAGVPRVPKNPRNLSDPRNPSSPSDPSKPWPLVRLGDVCEVITGNTPSKAHTEYYGGDIPFFKPSDLEQGANTIQAGEFLTEAGFAQARQLPENTVLVTCIGATLGKTGIIRKAGACNQQINALIPRKALPEYLYYAICSPPFQATLWSTSNATTLPIVNKSRFESLSIPLPPLPVQRAIVSRLDAARKRADSIAALARQAAEAAANLRKALLKEAFE